MQDPNFYSDRKYCPSCDDYRAYLMSVSKSYCVECGGEVRLFSKDDWTSFNDSMQTKRPKGGRPRKNTGNSKSA